jgi:hypothetical protein
MLSVIAWIKEGKSRFSSEELSESQCIFISNILREYINTGKSTKFKVGSTSWQWWVRELNNNKDKKVLVEIYSW